jgi:hypothetical protein
MRLIPPLSVSRGRTGLPKVLVMTLSSVASARKHPNCSQKKSPRISGAGFAWFFIRGCYFIVDEWAPLIRPPLLTVISTTTSTRESKLRLLINIFVSIQSYSVLP